MSSGARKRLLGFSSWALIKDHPLSLALQNFESRVEKAAISPLWLQILRQAEPCTKASMLSAWHPLSLGMSSRLSLSQARLAAGGFRNSADTYEDKLCKAAQPSEGSNKTDINRQLVVRLRRRVKDVDVL